MRQRTIPQESNNRLLNNGDQASLANTATHPFPHRPSGVETSFSEENPLDSTEDSKDVSPIAPRGSVVKIKMQPPTKQGTLSYTFK
jgi:hypothetical protein